MPPPERMPRAITEISNEIEQRETAVFVRRICREHRTESIAVK
jgi:hypothetical protein